MPAASCPMPVPAPRRSPTNLSHTPTIWASVPRGRSLAADKVTGQTGGRASGRASNARAAGRGEAERGRAGGRGREGKRGRAGREGGKVEGRGRGNTGGGGGENSGSGGGGDPGSGGGSELWVGGRRRGLEGSRRAIGARTEQRSTARNMDSPRIYSRNSPYGNSPISLLPLHTNEISRNPHTHRYLRIWLGLRRLSICTTTPCPGDSRDGESVLGLDES